MTAGAACAQVPVYDDALSSGWSDWSWNTVRNFANTSPVFTGTQSIAVSSTGWGGLSLHHDGLAVTNLGALEFMIHGGTAGGQNIVLQMQNDDTGQAFTQVQLANPAYISGGSVSSGQWKKATVPLAAFGVTAAAITRLTWQDGSGSGLPFYYLDAIRFVAPGAVAPVLKGAQASDVRRVTAYFDQALNGTSLTSATFRLQNGADTNYAAGTNGAFAGYDPSRQAVDVVCPAAFGTAGVYTLTVNGIQNSSGLPVASNSSASFALRAATVSVDAAHPSHAISPLIYGVAFAPNAAYLQNAGIRLNRWGGNNSSRYNWTIGAANLDFDWYFENVDWDGADGAGSAHAFAIRNLSAGAATILSLPALPWIAKDKVSHSYSVAKYGPQQGSDPYRPDAGNGIAPGGGHVTNNPADASMPARAFPRAGDPTNSVYQDAWLRDLRARFGPSAGDFVPFIAIDNEPELWGETHRDVHPALVTYDELYAVFTNYAAMVRREFPDASILGPVNSGWWFYWNSQAGAADKAAHGNRDLIPWFLQKVRSNDVATGKRSLDVLDIHYYPTDVFNNDVSEATRAKRLRASRSFWDPAYIDEGWIGVDHWATSEQANSNAVTLLPRFRTLIASNYPGLKLGLTEWNMGGETDISGGLAVADVLGIFGAQNLHLAAYWSTPPETSPVYSAFRLYGNYDGNGRRFERLSLPSVSSDISLVGIAAARSDDGSRLTMTLVNKHPSNDVLLALQLGGFQPAGTGSVFRFGQFHPATVASVAGPVSATSTVAVVLPAYSATLLAWNAVPVDGDADGLSDAWESWYPAASNALADTDADGLSNLDEYRAGTDPTDGIRLPRIRFSPGLTNLWLVGGAPAGHEVVLDRSASVTALTWQSVATTHAGSGATAWGVTNGATNAFFRLRSLRR